MEPMDDMAVSDLRGLSNANNIVISAKDYNGIQLTALLRRLALLITSRYHAHVLSLPAGVPCVGVSKDNRLTDIFSQNGLAKYCVSTHDENIHFKLPQICKRALKNRIHIQTKLLDKLPIYQQLLSNMGLELKDKILKFTGIHELDRAV
jgi:polysaccharide pyruvyl transferase WcaK-like protein